MIMRVPPKGCAPGSAGASKLRSTLARQTDRFLSAALGSVTMHPALEDLAHCLVLRTPGRCHRHHQPSVRQKVRRGAQGSWAGAVAAKRAGRTHPRAARFDGWRRGFDHQELRDRTAPSDAKHAMENCGGAGAPNSVFQLAGCEEKTMRISRNRLFAIPRR